MSKFIKVRSSVRLRPRAGHRVLTPRPVVVALVVVLYLLLCGSSWISPILLASFRARGRRGALCITARRTFVASFHYEEQEAGVHDYVRGARTAALPLPCASAPVHVVAYRGWFIRGDARATCLLRLSTGARGPRWRSEGCSSRPFDI